MAESRQNLDDVLGLQGKAGGVTLACPPNLPTTPKSIRMSHRDTELVGWRAL